MWKLCHGGALSIEYDHARRPHTLQFSLCTLYPGVADDMWCCSHWNMFANMKGVEFPEMMSFRNMFIQARSKSLLNITQTPLGLTMINLLNLPALRPQSHVLRQGPCSFRQSWNPAVSSCPSLQCSGKVTCHDSHHPSDSTSTMQAGLKGNKSRGNIRNMGLPEPQHASDTSRATTKNDFLRSEDRRCHRIKVLRCRMVWCKSGLLIGSMADTSCHEKRQELRNLMICFNLHIYFWKGGGSDVIPSLMFLSRGNF